jgi:hypothetical protein
VQSESVQKYSVLQIIQPVGVTAVEVSGTTGTTALVYLEYIGTIHTVQVLRGMVAVQRDGSYPKSSLHKVDCMIFKGITYI